MGDPTDGRARHNALLRPLPAREYARLTGGGERIDADVRQLVYNPGDPISDVYFPVDAVYSMVATIDGEPAVEVGTIGREGMVGLPVFLGRGASPNKAFCQIPGEALRVPAEHLRAVLSDDGALHRQLHTFTQATMVQLSQNVACNRAHLSPARASRWLLMTHDRVGRDEFPLTHEFLAQMLGVRRATVSEVAGQLQAAGLIAYRRGMITIVDRAGLEERSCACYRIVREEFERLQHG